MEPTVEPDESQALTQLGSHSDAFLALLPERKQLFARHYAETGNATQSAIAAGYSEKSASMLGSRLLKEPKVRAAIERVRAETLGKFDVTDETVLRHLLKEATWSGKGSSHAARVSALKELADIKGLHKTPDIGSWQGISTIRLEILAPDGTKGTLELGPAKK